MTSSPVVSPANTVTTSHVVTAATGTSTATVTGTPSHRPPRNKRRIRSRLVPSRIFHTLSSSVRKTAAKRIMRVGGGERRYPRIVNQPPGTLGLHTALNPRSRHNSSGSGPEDHVSPIGELTPLIVHSRLGGHNRSLASSLDGNHSLSARGNNHHQHHPMAVIASDMDTVTDRQELEGIQAQVLSSIERILRHALLLMGVYTLGSKQYLSFLTPFLMWNGFCFIGVAWGTCALIQVISWTLTTNAEYSQDDHHHHHHHENVEDGHEEGIVALGHDDDDDQEEVNANRSLVGFGMDQENGSGAVDSHPFVSNQASNKVYQVPRSRPTTTTILDDECRLHEQSKRQEKFFRRRQKRGMKARNSSMDSAIVQQKPPNAKMDSDVVSDASECEVQEVSQTVECSSESNRNQVISPPQQHHPELEDLYIIDLLHGERITPGEPYHLDCDMFSGVLLVMCRTSDADSNNNKVKSRDLVLGSEVNAKYSDYFRNKLRRFEIQLQIKFKKTPPSRLFFHCQVDEPIKLGVVQRAFVAATLNLIEKRNHGGFVYNVPGKEPKPDELLEGRYEKPHITFAAEKAFDRLVVTKEGDVLPTLGTEIYEDPEAMKFRRKNEFTYNTSDTYTFALWSAYSDFTRWKCVNLPAIGPFSLSSIIRDQNFSLHLYYLDAPDGENRHMECYQKRIASFELNHAKYCKMSEARRNWLSRYESSSIENSRWGENLSVQEPCVQLDDESVSEGVESNASFSDSEASVSEDDEVADDQYSYDEDEETRALEELGEGIYLKSGDPMQLRELSSLGIGSILTNGGGFATLQSDNAATITIEKVSQRSRNISSANSQGSYLIRNGDVVMLKLIDDRLKSSNYLTIHKGWWLKWVQQPPRNTNLFTIHTNDVEEDVISNSSSEHIGIETQSSYLRLGGTFRLKSKMSALDVGVRVKSSAKFGGRVLGLYKEGSYYVADPNDDMQEAPHYKQMMMPLKLCAYMPLVSDHNVPLDVANNNALGSSQSPVSGKNGNCIDDFTMDAPAWLEVMHRSKRHIFRVYAIRMSTKSKIIPKKIDDDIVDQFSSLRLRTGKELTPLLQFGALYGKDCHHDESDDSKSFHISSPTNVIAELPEFSALLDSNSLVDEKNYDSPERPYDLIPSPPSRGDSDSDEECGQRSPHSLSSQKLKGSKKWIRSTTHGITKVAKGVKTGTIKSGSMIGKAVSHKIMPHGLHKRRYLREKQRKASIKGKSKDHHIAVNKALKTVQVSPRIKNTHMMLQMPSTVMAGQLKAPDQSCRTVSYILSSLSSEPSSKAKDLLSSHLLNLSDIDLSFLSGGAVELGVIVGPTEYGKPCHEYVVARALWDSHWREEAAIIFESSVSFYAPLSKKPDISIPLYDVQKVRRLEDANDRYPLSGFPLVAIETAWKCHYIAFKNEDIRTDFLNALHTAVLSHYEYMPRRDEWNARMWQHVQSSADSSGESEKWASIISSKKRKKRIILNSRRMPFDCDVFPLFDNNADFQLNLASFVEKLLQKALSFSLENMMKDPKDFVQFLDETSKLRVLPVKYIDKSDKSAFCIYVNIYHCLLQHSLLLSTGGPPTKRNVAHFMRTHCYEIGGDIFSLAELESYVIRGNLPKPFYPRPPFVPAPKKSRGHIVYSLEYVDPRLPFILNNGNTCNLPDITVLKPSILESQLSQITQRFLQTHLKVDKAKRVLILPKVCDVYRNDFGDTRACIDFCLKFMNDSDRSFLIDLLENSSNTLAVKYSHNCGTFYPNLKENIDTNNIGSTVS